MRRLLIVSVVCLSVLGSLFAQSGKQNNKPQLVANGGYWLSSGTIFGSKDALATAARFGCYASLCKVELNKDNEWVMSSGTNKQAMDEFLLSYKQVVCPDKKITKDQYELEDKKDKSKKNMMKLILDFNPGQEKEPAKLLLPILKKLMKQKEQK